ncbi:MAG: winged helix-turn-helix domain-containing protein [Vicinamibacteraceae bacterium]
MLSAPPRYAFGDVELDAGRVLVLKGGTPATLEPKAFAVLQLLAERAPHVVDKAEIFAVVWKDTAVTDNALTRIVAQLRKALDDDAKAPRYIATVSARGYRLLPPVQRLEGDATSASIAAPVPIAPPPAAASPHSTGIASTGTVAPGPIMPDPIMPDPGTPGPGTPVVSAASRRRWPLVLAIAAIAAAAILGTWLALGKRLAIRGLPFGQHVPAISLVRSVGDLDLATAAGLSAEQMTVATGFDGYLAFSPDGTTIAYASDRSGALEIYVEGLAEGAVATSLTPGAGQCIQPAWSPDGRFIAYADLGGGGIWIVPSRGGSARKVAEFGAHPSWSPDGRRIAFQSRPPADLNPGGSFGSDSTIWIVDTDGRMAPKAATSPGRPLGSHGMPQWWPGSERIVFAVSAPAGVFMGAALWTVDARGGEAHRLALHARLSSEFVVAPDGQGVLFTARDSNALWWLPVDDTGAAAEPRPTALSATGPSVASLAISADGRRIAWTAGASSSGIWAAAVGGSAAAAATPLVPPAEIGWRAGHPAVSPDGRVAFMGNRGNAGNKIFLVEPGRTPRQLTTDARDHFSPQWLKNEDAIVMLANHGDGMGWWRLDPHTGRERLLFYLTDVTRPAGVQSQVIGPSAGMSISADFTRLAVAYVRDGVPNLWTTTLVGQRPVNGLVQRTTEAIGGAFGSWSHDSAWLAYQCGRGGDTQVCAIAADGTAPARQLTQDPGTNFIGEWIDDDAILFAGKQQAVWNVRSVSPATGKVSTLTAFTEPRFYVRYPRWDPTGRRVVFERYETTGRLWSLRIPPVTVAEPPARGSSR